MSAPYIVMGHNRGLTGYWTGKYFSDSMADAVPFKDKRAARFGALDARRITAERHGWKEALRIKIDVMEAESGKRISNPLKRTDKTKHRAYYAAVKADEKFRQNLKRQFLTMWPGDARHNEHTRKMFDARTKKAYEQFLRASKRWRDQTLKGRKTNPVKPLRSQVDEAGRAYTEFSGHPVKGARRVKTRAFRVGWPLGKLDGVLYSTVRDGKPEKYVHRFASQSRPLLVVSSDGKNLGIVGGRFQVTEAGIEDA